MTGAADHEAMQIDGRYPGALCVIAALRAMSARCGWAHAKCNCLFMDFNSRLQFGRFMCQSLSQLKGTWKGVTEKFRTRFSVRAACFSGARSARDLGRIVRGST
jgi:hypothetical protein